jgi:hypothetical protein
MSIDCDRASAVAYRAQCVQVTGRDLAGPQTEAILMKYGLDRLGWKLLVWGLLPLVRRSLHKRIRYWCHHCKTQYAGSGVCSQCKHKRCKNCSTEEPHKETTSVSSLDSFVGSRAPTDALIGETTNPPPFQDPADNDGPSGSPERRGTARDGSSTLSPSLQTPDNAIVREERGRAYVPGSRLSNANQWVASNVDSVSPKTLHPYVLFCVPTPAVSPHGAYLSHICRKEFTGYGFFAKLNSEFDRLRGSTRWSKFWARFRVIGCQEIKLVRVSVPVCLSVMR